MFAQETPLIRLRRAIYEGMPHAFSLSTLDGGHPTGRALLDRVAAWVSDR